MDTALFPNASRDLPEPTQKGFVVFRLDSDRLPPVRFVNGYQTFADFVVKRGDDPEALRDDLARLIAFLAQHHEVLEDRVLRESAGLFLGNTIAALHLESQWRVTTEPEVGPDGFGFPVYSAVRALIEQPKARGSFYRAATAWIV